MNCASHSQCNSCVQLQNDVENSVQVSKKLKKKLVQFESKLEEYEDDMDDMKEQILGLTLNLNRLASFLQYHKLEPLSQSEMEEMLQKQQAYWTQLRQYASLDNSKCNGNKKEKRVGKKNTTMINSKDMLLCPPSSSLPNPSSNKKRQELMNGVHKKTESDRLLDIQKDQSRRQPKIIHRNVNMMSGHENGNEDFSPTESKATLSMLIPEDSKKKQKRESTNTDIYSNTDADVNVNVKVNENANVDVDVKIQSRYTTSGGLILKDEHVTELLDQKEEINGLRSMIEQTATVSTPVIIEDKAMLVENTPTKTKEIQCYKKGDSITEELLRKAFELLSNPPQSDDESVTSPQCRRGTDKKQEGLTFEGFCYGLQKLWIQWDIDECKIMFNKLALVGMKRKSSIHQYDGTSNEILKLKIKHISFAEFKEAMLYWPEVFGHNDSDVKDFENLIGRLIAPSTPHVKIFGKSYLRCVEDFSDTDSEAQGRRSRANTQGSNGNSPHMNGISININKGSTLTSPTNNKTTIPKLTISPPAMTVGVPSAGDSPVSNGNIRSSITSGKKSSVSVTIMNEDEIFKELEDYKSNQWQSRTKALKQLGKLFTTAQDGIDSNSFENKFQRFQELLANHVKDRRSVVCKEACKQLATIIKYRKTDFYPFVAYFIERCLEIIRSNIQVMSQSGDECVMAMITSIPEHCDTYLILRALLSAFTESNRKYAKSREHIIKYVHQIMLQAHNASLMNKDEYVDELCAFIAQGCEDADATVRNQSFEALKTLQLNINAVKAKKIVDNLSPGALRKYQRMVTETGKEKEKGNENTKEKEKEKEKENENEKEEENTNENENENEKEKKTLSGQKNKPTKIVVSKPTAKGKQKPRLTVREMREQMQKNQKQANIDNDSNSHDPTLKSTTTVKTATRTPLSSLSPSTKITTDKN